MQTLNVLKLDEKAILPTRNHPNDAGLDLYALEDSFIELGKTSVIKTGVAIEVPVGYVLKIEDRSGLASKGLRTGAGVVDAGYAGPVNVVMHNLTNSFSTVNRQRGFFIHKGDKVAQALLYKVETPAVNEVTTLWTSDRGPKGFGSSDGKKETTPGRIGNS